MKLKVYADRLSQPSRAVIIFCKINGIDFEEVTVDLLKRQQFSPELKEINPMAKVPAIVDGRFKLFESHAILIYLASVFSGVADHCPSIQVISRSVKLVQNSALRLAFGRPLNLQAAAEGEKICSTSLSMLESFWLKGSGRFLLGGNQPSIADLSLVCEIMQLEIATEFLVHTNVQQWMEDAKKATSPHFDDVHKVLFEVRDDTEGEENVSRNWD